MSNYPRLYRYTPIERMSSKNIYPLPHSNIFINRIPFSFKFYNLLPNVHSKL